MPASSSLQYVYWAYFSKPVCDRKLFRLIRQRRIGRILEIGVGEAVRARRLISVAQRYTPGEVRYTGLDPFESRSSTDAPGLTLKLAHRLLKATGAQVQLVPGDPFSALSRTANSLTETELVVISADQDGDSLSRAWHYLPRTLSPEALVFVERLDPVRGVAFLQEIDTEELQRLASVHQRRRAA
ncbi:MAG: hypothetical protein KF708_23665 [Pirellulales bacterium]|nr:hypothetical protein [Pirellulales bacterium]